MKQTFKNFNVGSRSLPMLSTLIVLGVVSSFFLAAFTLYATETQDPPEEILINNDVYRTDRKGVVYFPHLPHVESFDIDCDGCHHDYQNGKNVWDEDQPVKKCFTCHDPTRNHDRVKKLRTAFHNNCKGCHKKLAREEGAEAPYKQCTDCHGKP